MTITPLGQVLPLGDYNDTVLKYKNNQLKTVEDCSSCMDYAYLRLKNFYNTDFYLNKKSNKYNQMVLNSKKISRELRSGTYLKQVIRRIC